MNFFQELPTLCNCMHIFSFIACPTSIWMISPMHGSDRIILFYCYLGCLSQCYKAQCIQDWCGFWDGGHIFQVAWHTLLMSIIYSMLSSESPVVLQYCRVCFNRCNSIKFVQELCRFCDCKHISGSVPLHQSRIPFSLLFSLFKCDAESVQPVFLIIHTLSKGFRVLICACMRVCAGSTASTGRQSSVQLGIAHCQLQLS
jgi:hypothetical protein